MTTKIIVAGNSLLSWLIALEIDRKLADHAHIQATYFTTEPNLVYWPKIQSLLHPSQFPSKTGRLKHLEIINQSPSAINLLDRRVAIANRHLTYDHLILDQTPILTSGNFLSLSLAFNRLIAGARGRTGRRGAHLRFIGHSAVLWQLGLSAWRDLTRERLGRLIKVYLDLPAEQEVLSDFFDRRSLRVNQSPAEPGLTVKLPGRFVDRRKIRGLTWDKSGFPILDAHNSPFRFREAVIIDDENRLLRTACRPERETAGRIVANLEARFSGAPVSALDPTYPAVLLNDLEGRLVWLNGVSQGLKAQIVSLFDAKAFNSF